MSRGSVPTGEERHALFDQLSALFRRCAEQALALEEERRAALRAIPGAAAALTKRDAVVTEAQRKADALQEKGDRATADAVLAADRDFFDTAQAADARRQQSAADADDQRERAVQDATELFDDTMRAIHNATAGLHAFADAEQRARADRDKAIREAEQTFRGAIEKADAVRQAALDAAAGHQSAAHGAADQARWDMQRDAQAALETAIADADRALDAALAGIPAAQAVEADFSRRRADLQRIADEQKHAV